jgi:hypothetical protein
MDQPKREHTKAQPAKKRSTKPSTNGYYIYGVVLGDVDVVADAKGVAGAPIEAVRSGDIAALVSPAQLDRPIGDRSDLTAHKEILDSTVIEVPVLPVRFGAVVSSREAVVDELLQPYHDEFAEALHQLAREVQYVVHARYIEPTIMRDIFDESPDAARLRDQIGGDASDATRNLQVRLGELLYKLVEAKRAADTNVVVEAVSSFADKVSVRPPSDEFDAAHVAVLIERGRQRELEDVMDDLARRWTGRARVSLYGPEAPYDFVVTTRS